MALLWARRIGNIRTPMPITNAELEQHQRGAADEQRGGAAAVSGEDDAHRYEVAYAICQEARKEKDPNDSGGPTHAGVRANDWRGGRVVGGGFPVQNGHGQSSSPHANATCCVGSGWCPAAASGAFDYYHEPRYTRHPLIASPRRFPCI